MNYTTVRRNNLNLWSDFDRTFEAFFGTPGETARTRTPVTRVAEDESGLKLTVELPGFGPEDLDVKVEENLLTIKAPRREMKKADKKKEPVRQERSRISFEKSFVLPQDIRADKIEADLKNGLLTLTLPRAEKPAPLKISVKG